MAGKIIADTIEHSSAGSVDTTYVVDGSAKSWTNFNGVGTVAIRGSLNTSSMTDNNTGNYNFNFTNSFTDTNYLPVNRTHGFGDTPSTYQSEMTTSSRRIDYYNQNTVKTDRDSAGGVHYGDLA
tara:strand:- start:114 stop:485 length:372 start_codon:yes stop_codon:yes gene_type:complete